MTLRLSVIFAVAQSRFFRPIHSWVFLAHLFTRCLIYLFPLRIQDILTLCNEGKKTTQLVPDCFSVMPDRGLPTLGRSGSLYSQVV